MLRSVFYFLRKIILTQRAQRRLNTVPDNAPTGKEDQTFSTRRIERVNDPAKPRHLGSQVCTEAQLQISRERRSIPESRPGRGESSPPSGAGFVDHFFPLHKQRLPPCAEALIINHFSQRAQTSAVGPSFLDR